MDKVGVYTLRELTGVTSLVGAGVGGSVGGGVGLLTSEQPAEGDTSLYTASLHSPLTS